MSVKKINDSEKIVEILQYFNLKKSEFSTKTGMSTQQIFDLIRGQIANLSRENMEKIISAFPEISPFWLITGEGDLHRSYMPRLKGANYEYKEVIYLTLEELQSVEHADLPKHLATVRDVFVFCCYTGLRFSDAAALRRSDVYSNCIEIVTRKTDKRIRIDLNKHAAAILERYADIDFPDGRALPAISNQQTNKYLKQICKSCNIDSPTSVVAYSGNKRIEATVPKYELITTHCARRTFVVTALQLGIPIEVITRWTGHGDIKSLKPYVSIVDSLKAAQMAKFDTL